MNLLREETYAQLFGHCVAYDINPEIVEGLDFGSFPSHYFVDFKSDLKRIKKGMKKEGFVKSVIATVIGQYYFRAIANNFTGENLVSDKIPKFCHRLFSERNFKHPIEKKPPKWFDGFLKD